MRAEGAAVYYSSRMQGTVHSDAWSRFNGSFISGITQSMPWNIYRLCSPAWTFFLSCCWLLWGMFNVEEGVGKSSVVLAVYWNFVRNINCRSLSKWLKNRNFHRYYWLIGFDWVIVTRNINRRFLDIFISSVSKPLIRIEFRYNLLRNLTWWTFEWGKKSWT